MSELFPLMDSNTSQEQDFDGPLADRMRPKTLDDVLGQSHLTAEGKPLNRFFAKGYFPSMIFWGPPGTGKTTIAMLCAGKSNYRFIRMSAIDSGVKELRQVIVNAKNYKRTGLNTLLFIDEIHRFNKSQQDAFLHAVESGIITLVGATTENPSFEVNAALLSRCQVYRLRSLTDDDIKNLIQSAIQHDKILKEQNIVLEDIDFIVSISGGDARTALNALELSIDIAEPNDKDELVLTKEIIETALQQKTAQYDKKGESHYDTISAFIKSLRGSDPDAAIIWLAKMIDAGEDPKFIARRLVIFASEDIGNAEPLALPLAIATFKAVEVIGLPEARINLAHAVTFLASSPKSNASYFAIKKAETLIQDGLSLAVPLHLRNAPTKLMKAEGYGIDYKYPHSYTEHFINENYFPVDVEQLLLYKPTDMGKEKQIKDRLYQLWKQRYEKE